MGLFPDNPPPSASPANNETGSSSGLLSIRRSIGLFRSESANNDKKTATATANNIQQLSTSWEFIRPTLGLQNSDGDPDKNDDEPQDLIPPPRFIDVQKGRIQFITTVAATAKKQETAKENTEVLEARIAELEEALFRLQERVNQSQCGSPTLERDFRDQLDSMNRALKSKDRRAMQACRDHKTLQARFCKQETSMQLLQNENKTLHERIRQYEHCLDEVMRKVVDAIVAEDSLRDEVCILKNRVRDLEAQNAALIASPAKGRGDEGYCTMSSGQPPPSANHLEDLPEEPEQWLVSAEPCSAEMEDWSMSQEELETALEEDNNDWIWNSANFLNSTSDENSEEISALLDEQIIYSDDEDLACKDFTRDFYRLVNIKSESTRSLRSLNEATNQRNGDDQMCGHLTDSSSDGEHNGRLSSPTPSEAGREQVISCSSSDSDDLTLSNGHDLPPPPPPSILNDCGGIGDRGSSLLEDVLSACHRNNLSKSSTMDAPKSAWRRSNGWTRISGQFNDITPNNITTTTTAAPKSISKANNLVYPASKIPPPVPKRKNTYAS